MDNAHLLAIAQRTIAQTIVRLHKLYPQFTRDCIDVKLNNRLKTTAGRCWIETGLIDLSPSLMRENLDEFVRVTIPHEVAHQAAWDLFEEPAHGRAWKQIMRALDLEPSPWHYMTTAAQRAKKARQC